MRGGFLMANQIIQAPKNMVALKKHFEALPDASKKYLSKLEALLRSADNLELAIAYCAMKLEEGNHRALKCGLVRIHSCDSSKVDEALSMQHFTVSSFEEIFKAVLGSTLPVSAKSALERYQEERNKLIHGKGAKPEEMRSGIRDAMTYMSELGAFVFEKTKKNPFGDLRGLKGRKELLPVSSTHWMLKGFGFNEVKSKVK
jgi:hypothetical protein